MSDFMTDLNTYLTVQKTETKTAQHSTNAKAGSDLEMTDFLKLMVAQFQNQSMDDTASTSEMMAQMVQMSVIQAVSNLSDQLTASSNMSYAASLVGKDVTIAETIGKKVSSVYGTVTGTGMLNGEQVLFVNGEQYKLSDVMAVGTIPASVSGAKSAAQTSTDTAIQASTVSETTDTRTEEPGETQEIPAEPAVTEDTTPEITNEAYQQAAELAAED